MTYGKPYGSGYPSYGQTSPGGSYGGAQGSGQPYQQQQQAPSTGYTPVNFDIPSGYAGSGVAPQQFYGSLIDPSNGRPSEVLCRLADALFFHMDQNCDVVGMRNTQHIEPIKYAWLMLTIGSSADEAQTVEMSLGDLYTKASIPHRIVNINGKMVPILDRRGWLHLITFEARAAPSESHGVWTKTLATLGVIDPATNTPFPTPIPRTAFPTIQDHGLYTIYLNWQCNAAAAGARARTQALIAQYTRAAGVGTAGLGAGAGLGAYGGAGGANPYLSAMMQSQAQSSAAMQQQLAAMGVGGGGGGGAGPTYAKAAASVFSTLMGAGGLGGGFTGFGS